MAQTFEYLLLPLKRQYIGIFGADQEANRAEMALHLPSRCVGRAEAQYADAAKRDEDTWMQTRSRGDRLQQLHYPPGVDPAADRSRLAVPAHRRRRPNTKVTNFFCMNFFITDPIRLESYQLYFFTVLFFSGKTRPGRGFSYQLYFDTTTSPFTPAVYSGQKKPLSNIERGPLYQIPME